MTAAKLQLPIRRAALLLAACVAALAGGCKPVPANAGLPEPPDGDASIAFVKSLCTGAIYDIDTDIVISGVVVGDDRFGEFYKSIVIADDTAGIEVEIDGTSLFRRMSFGSRVEIFCNGMTLARVGGKIVLGAHPTGDFPIDGIDTDMIDKYIRIADTPPQPADPRDMDIAAISAADISSYIVVSGVAMAPDSAGATWCDADGDSYVTTTRRVVDAAGSVLAIRTDGRCSYAGVSVPAGRFAVAGIVDYSGGAYFLRISNMGIYPE